MTFFLKDEDSIIQIKIFFQNQFLKKEKIFLDLDILENT